MTGYSFVLSKKDRIFFKNLGGFTRTIFITQPPDKYLFAVYNQKSCNNQKKSLDADEKSFWQKHGKDYSYTR